MDMQSGRKLGLENTGDVCGSGSNPKARYLLA